jgi:hypothetical protein
VRDYLFYVPLGRWLDLFGQRFNDLVRTRGWQRQSLIRHLVWQIDRNQTGIQINAKTLLSSSTVRTTVSRCVSILAFPPTFSNRNLNIRPPKLSSAHITDVMDAPQGETTPFLPIERKTGARFPPNARFKCRVTKF